MTHSRVAELIERLGMIPHPEGGYYGEVFRSPHQVQPDDDRDWRTALSTIYYMLVDGKAGRWHRFRSDEVWHFYEGDPLELYWIDEERGVQRHLLGPVGEGQSPCAVAPAGRWQAARTTGAYTLVGCTGGPGFEYEDFEMRSGKPARDLREGATSPELGERM